MRIFKYFFLFFAFAFNANLAMAWGDMPSADKENIQKTLTKVAAERLKIDIKSFRLSPRFIKQSNDWIFITLDIQDATGRWLIYPEGHDLHSSRREGQISNMIEALLRKNDGNWELIDIAFNATDVAWDGWGVKYHAPKHIFSTTCLNPESEECKRLNQIPVVWQGTWHPPPNYFGSLANTPKEPSTIIINDRKIMWEPCGTEARKVKVFSRFYAKTSGILLEIEGQPCLNEEEGHSISYIHRTYANSKNKYRTYANSKNK